MRATIGCVGLCAGLLLSGSLGAPPEAHVRRRAASSRSSTSKDPRRALELIGKSAVCEGTALFAQIVESQPVDAPTEQAMVTALLPHLLSADDQVLECARSTLNNLDVVPALQPALTDAAQREAALQQAALLSHAGLLPLYRDLSKHKDAELRAKVAAGLRNQAPTAPTLDLLRLLVADPVKSVRWWAVDSLGMLLASGCDPARAILIQRRQKEQDASLRPFIEKALR